MEAFYIIDHFEIPRSTRPRKYDGRGKFRINPPTRTKKLSTVDAQAEAEQRAHHARKPHKKSRTGCQTCKRRRVKCDELRPVCRRCTDHAIDCVYNDDGTKSIDITDCSSLSVSTPTPPVHLTADVSFRLAYANMQLEVLLQSADRLATTLDRPKGEVTSDIEVFSHFCNHAYTTTAVGYASQAVIKEHVIPYALTKPSLMHSLLAVSSRHLMYLQPNNQYHRLSHLYHAHQAASYFQAELNTAIGPHNVDLMLTNSLFINVVCFAYDGFAPEDSWVLKPSVFTADDAPTWMTLPMNHITLFRALQSHIGHSFWHGTFCQKSDTILGHFPRPVIDSVPYVLVRPGDEGMPSIFTSLYSIDSATTNQNNPFHLPLRLLTIFLTSPDPETISFSSLSSFVARIPRSFQELLYDKDERALLLFAYWLAMLTTIGLWYVTGRARNECTAICMLLANSADERIRLLIRAPAMVIGYELVDEPKQNARAGAEGRSHQEAISTTTTTTEILNSTTERQTWEQDAEHVMDMMTRVCNRDVSREHVENTPALIFPEKPAGRCLEREREQR